MTSRGTDEEMQILKSNLDTLDVSYDEINSNTGQMVKFINYLIVRDLQGIR